MRNYSNILRFHSQKVSSHKIQSSSAKKSKFRIQNLLVEADAQEMGGHLSHEYHYVNQIGDEKLMTCSSCSDSMKDTGTDEPKCAKCGGTSFEKHRGIEVTLYLPFIK